MVTWDVDSREELADIFDRVKNTGREVERLAHYHAAYDRGEDQPFSSPLIKERSLYLGAA